MAAYTFLDHKTVLNASYFTRKHGDSTCTNDMCNPCICLSEQSFKHPLWQVSVNPDR